MNNGKPTTEHKRVVVAMSGGVDSSVAAALLKERGFEVIGATLQMQPAVSIVPGESCQSDGTSRARAVAGILQIPHHVIVCEKEFEDTVLKPAWEEYASGRTPSPCLWCNERLKFGLLAAWAKTVGAVAVATGHYAQRLDDEYGNPIVARAIDRNKDQSYFLARLTVAQRKTALFPLGSMLKSEVRAAARRFGLPNAEQTESQDSCLVLAGDSFAETLRQRFEGTAKPGAIVDQTGNILGHHRGIHRFTVGQRRGLNSASHGRLWVTAIKPDLGAVVVTHNEQYLLGSGLTATETCWQGAAPTAWPVVCEVQVRYRHAPVPAEIEPLGPDSVRITFRKEVRAITPGQAAVFYRGDCVLGSGWINADT